MTDLTEQWQKGELPEGVYYCEITLSPCIEEVFLPCVDDKEIVVKVLDKKPSYDEWKASEKYIKSLEEKIKIYERKEKQHTNDSIAYNELAEENEKLKEAVEFIKKGLQETIDSYRMTPISRAELLLKELNEVLNGLV